MEKRTRVLLADANEEFRILLRQLLEETGEFEVAASTCASWQRSREKGR